MTACAQALAKMAAYDNIHSRLVAWLKIILPIVALALLSMLFLLAQPSDPVGNVPYADVDVDSIIAEQRISQPSFSGLATDGSSIRVQAESAKPNPDATGAIIATDLSARIDLTGGTSIDMAARTGEVDGIENIARLQGGVAIETSRGLTVTTQSLTSALDDAFIETDGPVSGKSPLGELTAGKMKLSRTDDGAHLLVFQDGVELIYMP